MKTAISIAIIVLAGTAGDIAISHAMKQLGEVESLRPRAICKVLRKASRTGWVWVGIGLMALAFFSLLAVLSWADVSVVVPATALSYVAAAVGAKYLLHETVSPMRWAGVLLVCLGVALVSLS
jgi:multidrug transporter EmrE-like cation transporter